MALNPRLVVAIFLALSFFELNCARAQDSSEPSQLADSSGATAAALASHARIALREKEYDRAAILLRNAISANPGDAGSDYDPTDDPHIDERSLSYGETQLESMLADRPLMRLHIDALDDLWTWTSRKYGTHVEGSRIEWDPTVPNWIGGAEHVPPTSEAPGKIRVAGLAIITREQVAAEHAKALEALCGSTGQTKTFERLWGSAELGLSAWAEQVLPIGSSQQRRAAEEAKAFDRLWARAIFELHNIENAHDFKMAWASACKGELDEDAFVRNVFYAEFRALQRTRKWYVEVYLDHAKKYNIPTDPDNWHCNVWGSREEIFLHLKDKSAYPWNPYAQYFQECIGTGSSTSSTKTQQYKSGDKVTVIKWNVKLTENGQDLNSQIQLGDSLTVTKIQGDLLWIGRGWINKSDVVPNDEAIACFTAQITTDPLHGYNNRAVVYAKMGKLDEAIADEDEVIRRDGRAIQYNNRGNMWLNKKEYDKAIADYSEATKLDPKCGMAYANRGSAWFKKREYERALTDYKQAIEVDSKYLRAYDNHAWLLATCPDEKFRDAPQAIEVATRACELTQWHEPNFLGTLGAAYAENGDFEPAIKWQTRALELKPDDAEFQHDGNERLELYKSGQPYHQKPKE